MQERSRRRASALAMSAAIVVACFWPRAAMPRHGHGLGVMPCLDKLVHVALFLAFALAWLRVRPAGVARSARGPWVVVTGVGLAVLTELGQGLTLVGRTTDVLDGLADVAGLLLGVLLAGSLARDRGRAERVGSQSSRAPARGNRPRPSSCRAGGTARGPGRRSSRPARNGSPSGLALRPQGNESTSRSCV